MKAKTVKGNLSLRTNRLTFPYVFIICIFFFLAGFFGSTLFSHSQDDGRGLRPRPRLLESTAEYNLMTAGEFGDDSITSIPFQEQKSGICYFTEDQCYAYDPCGRVLSWKPRALYFPNFATAEQCKSIVDVAKAGLKPSALALRKGETEQNTKGIRTSSGVFVSSSEDKTGTLGVIEEKIARATMIPRSHGEAFNILRYEVDQRYNPHYDSFNPSEYGPQKSQRMASFLLYLTDVEEGGETMFPFENGLNMDGSYRYEDCIGLRVKPRQGDGLLFYSLFPNGTIDATSLHGSCPVIKGEKWVATKWIRDHDQDY